MAISYKESAGVTTAAAGFNIAETAASPVDGDVRLAITVVASSVTVTVPTGWTTLLNDNSFGGVRIVVFYRAFATGVGTQACTYNTSANQVVTIYNLGNQPDVSGATWVVSNKGGTSGTSFAANSITPSTSSGMLLTHFSETVTGGASGVVFTTPAGMTATSQITPTGTNTKAAIGSYLNLTSTSATGTKTATSNIAGTAGWTATSIFIPAIAETTVPISDSDTGTTTDTAFSLAQSSTVTDTGTTTDTISTLAQSSAVSDNAAIAETSRINIPVSDTGTIAESAAVAQITYVSASDSATLSETASVFQSATVTGSDSATAIETASYTSTASRSDTASFTESASLVETGTVTDSGYVIETASISTTLNVSDSATFTEATQPLNTNNQVPASDTFIVTESASISVIATASDLATATAVAFASDGETANDFGVLTETAKINQSVSDTTTFTESAKISQSVSDVATFTETATASELVTDSATVTETAQLTILASEQATFVDNAQVFVDLEVTDNATATDFVLNSSTPREATDIFTLTEIAVVTVLPTVFEDNIYYPPPSTKTFRIIAQDHFTRQFIHWDLPVDGVQITYSLSGPNLLVCQLSSEMQNIMDLDPPLIPDRTWLHVEESGQIKASFLMTPFIDDPQTETRQIEGEGFSSYPSWITYEGINDPPSGYLGVQVDPADMIRKIWAEVQGYPDGDLGVKISSTKTPVKIGTPVENVQFTTSEGNQVSFQEGPYTLNWWAVTNCGDEITKLCQQTPIDYVEFSQWNINYTDVEHYVILGYPRVGSKRTDLGFREGENLEMLIPSYQGTNDNYASDVIVIGAGTGPSAVRAVSSGRIGLLRKTSVIQNQDISNHSRAQAIANFEFNRLAHSRFLIQNITIDVTHPNAEWGSFNCGDDILVQATVDYVGYIQDWYRITSFTYDPYFKIATINLDPSDSFSYGAENVDPYDELPTSGYAQLDTTQDFSNLFTQQTTTTPPTQQDLDNLASQQDAYMIQAIQQTLCTKFNSQGCPDGQCLYYFPTTQTTTIQGVTGFPVYNSKLGPLSDLSIVANVMVIGKTDYGHIITGNNIDLISSDGTVGQTSNTTSVISYPKPINTTTVDHDSPIVGEFQISNTDQSTSLGIVMYQARHAGLEQFVASDLTVGEAIFIRTNTDGSLTLLTGTMSSIGTSDVLVIERDDSGTIQVGPGIQINDGEAQLTGLQQAAQAILAQLQSGNPIGTDWSWTGEPEIVGQYNDQLIEMYSGYHNLKPDIFLTVVINGQVA